MWQSGIRTIACSLRYQRLLSAYIDSELGKTDAEGVAQHLRQCTQCGAREQQLRLARNALTALEIPPTRTQWSGDINHLPRHQSPSMFARFWTYRIDVPLPMAVCLMIALLATTIFTLGTKATKDEPLPVIPTAKNEAVKIVEVPVERVVMRTVYINQKRSSLNQKGMRRSLTEPGSNSAKRNSWSTNQLEAFRPAASANLRVVKEPEE